MRGRHSFLHPLSLSTSGPYEMYLNLFAPIWILGTYLKKNKKTFLEGNTFVMCGVPGVLFCFVFCFVFQGRTTGRKKLAARPGKKNERKKEKKRKLALIEQ